MPQIAGNRGKFFNTLGRYPYYTIPQIHLKDILDLTTQTIKKIALRILSKLPQNVPRLQERGVNFQKVPGGNPPDPPANPHL